MIKDETLNKLSVWGKFMNHVHDFYHVQVDWLISNFDNVNSVNNNVNKLIGQVGMELAAQRGSCDTDEKWFLYGLFLDLELIQEFQSFLSGEFISFSDDSGMDLLNW